ELQSRTVGDDRLEADDPAPAKPVETAAIGIEEPVEVSRLDDQALDHRLDPAGCQGAKLVETERGLGAIARVDQPGLEVAALHDLAGQPLEPARATRR